ncbi:MAG TPA: response regulator [Planctomycetaceae bacterium]|nr:response regulator [Planctomycetaceae bacterium]
MPSPEVKLPKQWTLLLVDDDAAVRQSLFSALLNFDFTIIQAAGPEEALIQCTHHDGPIDLALIDMSMPRMWGDELAKLVARIRPEMRIVFISGYSTDYLFHRGVLRPDDLFIQKPCKPVVMVKTLIDMLDPQPATVVPSADDSAGEALPPES